jgi:hypothetical protein
VYELVQLALRLHTVSPALRTSCTTIRAQHNHRSHERSCRRMPRSSPPSASLSTGSAPVVGTRHLVPRGLLRPPTQPWHGRGRVGCGVSECRPCLTTTPSVAESDAFDQRPPVSIFPPVHRFQNKMKTLSPAQSAAGSDASDVFTVSKKLDPSRPLPWRVPMALSSRW